MTISLLARRHCDAEGLILYRCVFLSFFFLFFRRLISEVTERISTKLGHTFTYDCYLKNVVLSPPGVYHPRAWGKNRWDRLRTLTENISAKEHNINHRKETRQSTRIPPPPNLVNVGPKTAKNDGRVSAHPLKFARRTSCRLTLFCERFRFNHIRQMAHIVDADAKQPIAWLALVRLHAGQAHAGLCRVFSTVYSSYVVRFLIMFRRI